MLHTSCAAFMEFRPSRVPLIYLEIASIDTNVASSFPTPHKMHQTSEGQH